MNKILVIESNKFVSGFICKDIESDPRFNAVQVFSFREAKDILDRQDDFFAAVMGLVLPDALDGEIVDLVVSKKIPSIVLTGSFDNETREKMAGKLILDYIVKQDMDSFKSIKHLISRIYKNQGIKALIVEDTASIRKMYRLLLSAHLYQIHEAGNGEEALKVLSDHPDIKLILTDYNMPHMDGFEFVRQVRKLHSKNEKAVIGISSLQDRFLSAKFLKLGANDFLQNPFLNEEFYARITQNVEMVEMFETLQEAAIRDPLTKLYNRRHFFEAGEKLFRDSLKNGTPLSAAMIDIDFFKKINDIYGHNSGDEALRQISRLIQEMVKKHHIVARMGGEEFCVLAPGMDEKEAVPFLDAIRKEIENTQIRYKEDVFNTTISVGVSSKAENSLEELLVSADERLYQAKKAGRNKVVGKTL